MKEGQTLYRVDNYKLLTDQKFNYCQKTKYQPSTDTLRIPQLWQFYRYQTYITRLFRLWITQ
jgi:hypothetical protein